MRTERVEADARGTRMLRAIRPSALSILAALGASAVVAQPDAAALFASSCAACHGASGQGTPGLAPPLAGTLSSHPATEEGRQYLMQVLLTGLSGKISSQGQIFTGAMPAQSMLDDAQLAAVATYVARDLNGVQSASFSAADFANARGVKTTHKELRALRERLAK